MADGWVADGWVADGSVRHGSGSGGSSTRRGPYLGIDVGQVRVGVAISDPDGILASPLVTIRRETAPRSGTPQRDTLPPRPDIAEIARIAAGHGCIAVIVGLPLRLNGQEGPAAVSARDYATLLSAAIAPTPVWLSDERMTTVVASRRLSERGVRGRRARAVVDQAAAVEILQGWLDAHRRQVND